MWRWSQSRVGVYSAVSPTRSCSSTRCCQAYSSMRRANMEAEWDPARDLAYRLYTVCERKVWAQHALGSCLTT